MPPNGRDSSRRARSSAARLSVVAGLSCSTLAACGPGAGTATVTDPGDGEASLEDSGPDRGRPTSKRSGPGSPDSDAAAMPPCPEGGGCGSASNGCTVADAGAADGCTTACGGTDLSGFIAKFSGVCTGFPGWTPNQCTTLALQWVQNLCLPVGFHGNAIDWAGETVSGFTWVANAPGLVPSPGDIVVYGDCNGVASVGHVDIAVSASASSCTWQSFDQNWQTDWNGTCYPPQLVTHNWCTDCKNVLGWQHLTAPIP